MAASGSCHDLYSFLTNHYGIVVRGVVRKLDVKAPRRRHRVSQPFTSSRDAYFGYLVPRGWTHFLEGALLSSSFLRITRSAQSPDSVESHSAR
ncbi:hypothetical protein X777_00722 [Ooceraea biroi]|uniref:Uncharacterized protein n=1 Tax=Ooceraea biroi TaxID=2015173 RepID=A0A026VVN7_OOCBI|nr:hypothetical protein X777_00722 [Ooceraea biroi]